MKHRKDITVGPGRSAQRLWYMLTNVPLRQLLRRAKLRMRSRLAPFWLTQLREIQPPQLSDDLPHPIFPPRTDQGEPTESGFVLRTPWGARQHSLPIEWNSSGDSPIDGSWLNRLHYMEFLEGLPTPLMEDIILDWIHTNPLTSASSLKVAWHPFATSIRAVVWMQQIGLRRDSLPSKFLLEASASIATHLRLIEKTYESDLRGNHLIKNVKALLWGAAFFSDSEGMRWRRLGERLLSEELTEQILPDGTHYERSPTYHCQVMADFLECHTVLPDGPLRSALRSALVKMGASGALLTHPDGQIAQFNDCALRNAYTTAQCLEVLSRIAPVTVPEAGPFSLMHAGYFGMRSAEDYLIVDCGPVAPDYLIGHGHGDILSFEWSLAGQRIFVDQGTFQNAAGRERDISRSSLSHNTVTIDGEEQCDFYGAHRCGRRARASLLDWKFSENGFTLIGTHDGFRHLPGAPRHVRQFEATSGGLVIVDRIDGRQPGTQAQASFLLHPACTVSIAGQEATITREGVTVEVRAPSPLRLEDAEWFPDLYVSQATKRIGFDLPEHGGPATTTFFRTSQPRQA